MQVHLPRASTQRLLTAFISFALAALLVGLVGFQPPARAAGPACLSSSPTGAYTAKVCLTVGSGSVLTGDAAVTATVSITGASPGIRKLEFTLDGGYLLTDVESPFTFTLPTQSFLDGPHVVRVSALLRDGNTATSPDVAVAFDNGTSTPPPPPTGFQATSGRPTAGGEPFVVVATGDGAGGRAAGDAVVGLIESWNPNLFLYTGDVYEKGTDTEFYNWYGRDGLRWGKFKSITNPIIGNHEYENGVAPGYFNYWSGVPDFYSYDAGGWHFIALNSTSQFNQFTPGTAQYEWLKADLAANPDGCALAYFHHPIVSVGPQGDTPAMNGIWKMMSANGVDAVVTGHDHNYQRWVPLGADLKPDPDGIVQFVAGGGGHGIQSAIRMDSRVAAISDTTAVGFGALRLELSGASAHFTYVNPDGTVRDEGTVQCAGAEEDVTAPSVPGSLTAATGPGPEVTLSWSAASDDQGVGGYEIRRDADVVGSVPGTQTSWTDTTTAPLTRYEYRVRAVDLAGNVSDWSSPISVTTREEQSTFEWSAVADAYVDAAQPTTTLGLKPELRLDTSPEQISYLRFTASGLGARTPSSVVLSVHAGSNLTAGFEVRRVTSPWAQESVTYDSRPGLGATLGRSGPLTAGAWTDVRLEGLVTGDGTYDVALVPLSATGAKLSSRESGNAARLTAEVTPGPVASPVSVSTLEDQPAAWMPQVTAGDSAELACSIATPPASGQASVAQDCSQGMYTARADVNGSDTFTYAVTDGTHTSTATVSVSIEAVNDAPVARGASSSTWEGGSTSLVLEASDVDGDCPLGFTLGAPSHGSATVAGAAGCSGGNASVQVVYTPEAAWTGTDSFGFVVRDPAGAEAAGEVTVTVTGAPAAYTVAASADAFTDASVPSKNYGTRADLRIDATPHQRAYLRFPVAGLGSSSPSGLVLRLRVGSSLAAGFEVRSTAGGWAETTLTAANQPASGTLLATSGPVTANTWAEIVLPAGAVSGDGELNVVLTPLSDTALRLESRETTTPPTLAVTR